MKPSIKTKLYFGAALSLAVIAILAGLNVHISRQSSASLASVYDANIMPAIALERIHDSFAGVQKQALGVLAGALPAAAAREELRRERQEMNAAWASFVSVHRGLDLAAEEIALTRAVGAQLKAVQPFFDRLDAAYAANDKAQIARLIDAEWPELHDSFLAPLLALEENEWGEARQAAVAGASLARRMAWLSAGVMLVSLLAMAWFVGWLITHIERNIERIQRGLEQVAAGQLDVHVEVTGEDELGKMAASLNHTLAIIKSGRERLEAMQHSRELILNAIGEGLFGTDAAGRITYANPAMERLLGYPPASLIGEAADRLCDGAGSCACPLAVSLDDGRPHADDDAQFRRRDGSPVAIEFSSTPVREGDEIVGAVVVCRDISERKQAQAEAARRYAELEALNRRLEESQYQLVQSEKMASLGQLAAGVAHEINNPIGFVKSNLGTLRTHADGLLAVLDAFEREASALPPGARAAITAEKAAVEYEYLREDLPILLAETLDGVSRVMAIVRDLKEFSHPDVAERQVVDLHRGLESTLNVVWHELKYKAEIVRDYAELPQIECFPAQLNQVFMNLLVNAAQAIANRGVITLRTGEADGGVWVEIADTGCGIAPETLGRIFEPFFTTKPVGRGTGLGLSLAYGIVQKHGGKIDVASELGRGTRFRVWLPRRQAAAETPVVA